ncbi:MAG: PIN domain-containing protein [Chloroflexota bacterium]
MLVDTGGLVAYADRRDRWHSRFRRFFDVDALRETLIVPVSVLPEVDYLVAQRAGAHVAIDFHARILLDVDLRWDFLARSDFPRILELMRQYADSNIGFVDASIVAVAERLGIRKIVTLDHRHFGMIRPRHCEALEILP